MITLIRPPSFIRSDSFMQNSLPPIGLAYIAASLKSSRYSPQVIDAIGEKIEQLIITEKFPNIMRQGLSNEDVINRIAPDVKIIGVSCMFSQDWTLCRDLINDIKIKFPDSYIISGGEHITCMYEYSFQDCSSLDCCVLGEGDETIVDLVEAIRSNKGLEDIPGIAYRTEGRIRVNPRRDRVRGLSELPWPEWSLFPMKAYADGGHQFGVGGEISMPVLASRGCPFQCTFCSSPQMWGTRWEARFPEELIDEIVFYMDHYNATNFDFFDLTAIIRKDWIVKFSKLIIDRNISITYHLPLGTRSEALDEEALRFLYESGCREIGYAPESWSNETIKLIKKKIKKDRMYESIKSALKNNMSVKATFIIGFPHERTNHLLENISIILKLAFVGVHSLAVLTFTPYPGSDIFKNFVEQGKLKINDNYFMDLVNYCRLGKSISYSDKISNKMLSYWNLFLVALFYIPSLLIRPKRLASLVLSIWRNSPTNRFEKAVCNIGNSKRRIGQVTESTPAVSSDG